MGCSTTASSVVEPSGNKPITEKIIEIWPEKKPTVILDDFVSPRDIFNTAGMGASLAHFKEDPSVKYRATKMHAFVETICLAYVHHLPLTLAPDDVWIAIMQGFSLHMEVHAEKLRSKFVDFDGKEKLFVEAPRHQLVDPNADWSFAFEDWASQIK